MKHVLFFAIALPTLVSASTVLTNTPAWNGINYIERWGDDGTTPTYGQTITVPSNGDNVLASFTFEMMGSPSINFDANVQAWNGNATTGSPLFSAVGTTLGSAGFNAYTFNPSLALTPGAVYVLYFTTIGVSQTNLGALAWGATFTGNYSGGDFWLTVTDDSNPAAGDVSDLNGSAWADGGFLFDLAFSATFTAPEVPEPRTFLLSATALAAIGFLRRLRPAA